MIQSIQDYENWRDRQYDLPEPDSTTPDEHATYAYSHDYPDDTKLEYVRDGEHAELRLSFTWEDPDTGVEEMLLGSDNGESLPELASDLRADISSYLDAQDTSSFFEQQGIPQAPGDRAAQWDDFTRTAPYAFEAILKDVERGMDTQLTWKPIESDKRDWLYSARDKQDAERSCIGHLRGDFGRDDNEFWTSWFDHQIGLKTVSFRDELQAVVNGFHEEGGLLQSFSSMSKLCRDGLPCDTSYGFHAESQHYEYCLRCTPRRGDYNFYLYCYDKSAQRVLAPKQAAVQQPPAHTKPKCKTNEKER